MDKYEELAIQAIGIVDYDIMKECQEQIEDEGDCDMVTEMAAFIKKAIAEATDNTNTKG